MHSRERSSSTYGCHPEEDEVGQKLCRAELRWLQFVFAITFCSELRIGSFDYSKQPEMGLVYNPMWAESQKASLFSRNCHFCARDLLFDIFGYTRLVLLKIRPPMCLNIIFSYFKHENILPLSVVSIPAVLTFSFEGISYPF